MKIGRLCDKTFRIQDIGNLSFAYYDQVQRCPYQQKYPQKKYPYQLRSKYLDFCKAIEVSSFGSSFCPRDKGP